MRRACKRSTRSGQMRHRRTMSTRRDHWRCMLIFCRFHADHSVFPEWRGQPHGGEVCPELVVLLPDFAVARITRTSLLKSRQWNARAPALFDQTVVDCPYGRRRARAWRGVGRTVGRVGDGV